MRLHLCQTSQPFLHTLAHRCYVTESRNYFAGRQYFPCKVVRKVPVKAQQSETKSNAEESDAEESKKSQVTYKAEVSSLEIDKEVTKFARNAATTFAPRASGATKNPAYRGSVLYNIFEAQAWIFLVIGGLLSFNVIFPSDQPDIARLIGMWSIWMFTIPSLRARECTPAEKDALNLLFLLIPVVNVSLPFVWKSFPFIYSADVLVMMGVYAWKEAWKGVYDVAFTSADDK